MRRKAEPSADRQDILRASREHRPNSRCSPPSTLDSVTRLTTDRAKACSCRMPSCWRKAPPKEQSAQLPSSAAAQLSTSPLRVVRKALVHLPPLLNRRSRLLSCEVHPLERRIALVLLRLPVPASGRGLEQPCTTLPTAFTGGSARGTASRR